MASYKRHHEANVICFVTMLLWPCTMARSVEFAGGTGSAANPYQIATAAQLVSIGSDPVLLTRHFALVADIDLDPNAPGGRVFSEAVIAPAVNSRSGRTSPPFTGSLDGRGHTIRNLTIVSTSFYIGLFGRVEKLGRVQNLRMLDVQMKNAAPPDANEPWGLRWATGALVGGNWGTVSGCTSSGLVIGMEDVGSLIGCNGGAVTDCYSTASVAGTRSPGGLVGINYGTLVRCYSVGPVSGPDAAGLVGSVEYNSSVQDCFWDVETSGSRIGRAGRGLSTAKMMDADVYSLHGWATIDNETRVDNSVWVISDGQDYPRLAWEGTSGQRIPRPVINWFEGRGSEFDPYRIVTAEQISLLGTASVLWDKHFVLCADLDLTGIAHEPIGVCRGTGFAGHFDGRGHVLSHLAVDGGLTPNYRGLFGYVDSRGRVRRLGLQQAVVTGWDYVGALAGHNEGIIDSCFAYATVTGDNSAGGLVGLNRGRVLRCYSLGSATGASNVGGLIGSHDGGLVAYCYAASAVKSSQAQSNAGGLIGEFDEYSRFDAREAYNYYLQLPSNPQPLDESPWDHPPGTALTDNQMRLRSSFVEWDFYGAETDGVGDHWFMMLGEYPALSWQTDVTGLRAVPDVRHALLDAVRQSLAEAGLALGNVSSDYDPSVVEGRAILTHPSHCAPLGQAVDVVQSLGPYNWNKNPGQGTQAAPYQIQTAGQLISTTWWTNAGHFVLMNDISLSGRVYTYSDCVLPTLRGSFDGQNHRVSDFEGIGLTFFDAVYPGATLCNLTLDRVAILDGSGGALSFWNGGSVVDCHLIGRVAGDGYGFGGLTGNNTGTMRGCSMQGAVKGIGTVWGLGGLVGDNKGTVEECRVRSCEVSGERITWGLAGLVGENSGTVRNCYSEVRLISEWGATGLVNNNSGTVASCWASWSATGPSAEWGRGRLFGTNTGVITNCYFPAGPRNNGLGTVLSQEGMYQHASFVGWDFETIWSICEGKDYPRLRWEQVKCE